MNKIEEIQTANPDLYKLYVDVMRPDGHLETVDISERFFGMTDYIAQKIRIGTAKAGRGEVLRIYRKALKTNVADLERAYNNLYNEGGEGYVPDFSDDPRVTVEITTEEW